MSDSVRPHRRQPTRLRRPWDSPGKNTGMDCHFLLQCMKVKSENEVTQLCLIGYLFYTHEIKRHLLLGRKFMTNLDSIFKSRDITLPTKVCLVKAMVFPVVMYGCESWAVKKAESWRIDAFELWCWRRLLRVPWTARRSNQSVLKEISPGCSLEGMMLKLKLQYFGHLMRRVDSLEKTLMLGGIGGRRKRGWQRMRWLDGITDSMDVEFEWTLGDGFGQGGLACCDSWGRKESDMTEWLNWTDVNFSLLFILPHLYGSFYPQIKSLKATCSSGWVGRGH